MFTFPQYYHGMIILRSIDPGGTWVNFFCWVSVAGPYPIILYSVANYRPHLITFGQICNFPDPNLLTFYIYELTHFLDNLNEKHVTVFFIYRTNLLVRLLNVNTKNCLTPKNLKMCDPFLVTLLKMRPHYSQFSSENATSSTGTSPLASYKLWTLSSVKQIKCLALFIERALMNDFVDSL